MTPWRPIGVRRGRKGSHRKSSLLPIGHLEVIYDPSRTALQFFVAIWIRVNKAQFPYLKERG
jgi:hypothetical protein